MEAIREIRKVKSNKITLKLPDSFNNTEVEIIILPYSTKAISEDNKNNRLNEIFKQSKGILPENYKFNREDAHER